MQETRLLETDKVLFESADGVATITLNRPEAGNALDVDMARGLQAIINHVTDDASIGVVVIRAAGKAFCVGGDIKAFQQHREQLPEYIDSLLEPLNQAIARLAGSGRIVVSVVHGAVGGAGIGLALCADFVLAAASVKLRGGYSAIGLTPDVGSSWFLAKRVGPAQAKRLLLLNEPYTAEQCFALGMIDAVYPDAELDTQARTWVERLNAGPRNAFARIKNLIDTVEARDLQAHLQLERDDMIASGSEANAQEGVAAFLEKRQPRFQ